MHCKCAECKKEDEFRSYCCSLGEKLLTWTRVVAVKMERSTIRDAFLELEQIGLTNANAGHEGK